MHKLKEIFYAVATHPAVLLGCGDTVLSVATANPVGMALQAGKTLLVAGLAAHARWKERPLSLPFYLLGAVNIISAAFGFASGDQSKTSLFANTALAGWGVGHLVSGRQAASTEKSPSLLKTNMTYYGLADMSAVASNPASTLNPVAFGAAAAGFLRTVFARFAKTPPKEGSLGWHLTPARFYAAGYFASAIVAAPVSPLFATASFLWGTGVLAFDPAQNRALKEKLWKRQAP